MKLAISGTGTDILEERGKLSECEKIAKIRQECYFNCIVSSTLPFVAHAYKRLSNRAASRTGDQACRTAEKSDKLHHTVFAGIWLRHNYDVKASRKESSFLRECLMALRSLF